MNKIVLRHGDVGFAVMEGAEETFEGFKQKNSNILAEGETTGHAHRVEGDFKLYEDSMGNLKLKVGDGGAAVTHEEHHKIDIKKGSYEIVIQEEYTPSGYVQVKD